MSIVKAKVSVMAYSQRIPTLLRRVFDPSSLKMILLFASDPRWEPLFSSVRRRKLDQRFEDPTLWFAWHSIPVVEEIFSSRPGLRVLEWGSGGSTAWYLNHGASVVSIEHDVRWFEVCKKYIGDRCDLRLLPLGDAYSCPDVDFGSFDVFVIDGRNRCQCAQVVADKIAEGTIQKGSIVIFDNSDRARYQEAIALLDRSCTSFKTYSGATCYDIDQTTTIYRV